jgi:predicted O-methyltransferase YrrM
MIYNNVSIEQPDCVVDVFWTFLSRHKPTRIIEIGTAFGGLTSLVAYLCPNAKVFTYDNRSILQAKLPPNVTAKVVDVFDVIEEVADLIRADGEVLLLCDGGDKVREFNTFAKYLKPGDVIMAHDYDSGICPEWHWIEIRDADIMETVAQVGLSRCEPEIMGRSAWVSYRKG